MLFSEHCQVPPSLMKSHLTWLMNLADHQQTYSCCHRNHMWLFLLLMTGCFKQNSVIHFIDVILFLSIVFYSKSSLCCGVQTWRPASRIACTQKCMFNHKSNLQDLNMGRKNAQGKSDAPSMLWGAFIIPQYSGLVFLDFYCNIVWLNRFSVLFSV